MKKYDTNHVQPTFASLPAPDSTSSAPTMQTTFERVSDEGDALSAVTIPLLQAIITGVITGLGAATLAVVVAIIVDLFNLVQLGLWLAGVAVGFGFVVFLAVTGYSWLRFRNDWQYRREYILGIDINNDGWIGEPPTDASEHVRKRITLEIVQDGKGDHKKYLDIIGEGDVADWGKFVDFARHAVSGGSLNYRTIMGRKLYKDDEYAVICDLLMDRGLAERPSKTSTINLTDEGQAVMRAIAAEEPDSPTPTN